MYSKNKKIFGALALSAGALGLVAVYAAATFDPDLQPVGYVAQPAVSKFIVSSGTEKLYAVDYNSQDWTGNLHNYNLSATGTIATDAVTGSEIDNWVGGAAAKINAQNYDTGRKIVTFNGTAGVPFRWTSGISATQKTALDANAVTANATASDILNYIRGDVSKQLNQTPAGTYRTRTSVLGDIIHSTPVHWNDGTNKTVFVGANDGMLHAINADDGSERFAYIPSVLIPKLAALTNPAYTHKYFVDGRLDIRKFGTQTILTGALGAGGKGLFGLDVTNAAATSETDAASKILWEITNTSAGFANLGYTYGAPTFLTLPNGTNAVAVGNGYNNTGNGHASLFLINAATGALIQEIDTGVGTAATPNGLSTPTLWDTNGDGKKDTAYAGDIDGNLWKFNLTTYTATKLHTTSPAQAITTAPSVIAHPLGGYMVNFVTGRMLTPGDKTNADTHYAYGIWDAAGSNTGMLTQTLTESTYTSGAISTLVRTASSTAPDWTTQKGWQTALPVGGERLVGDGALIKDSVFMFLSTNPVILPNATPPGANWWMQLNALTGGDNGAVMFDLNKDGSYNTSDELILGTDSLKPVGRYFGGGVRSQLIQMSVLGNDVFQSNYDKNGTAIPGTTTTATTSTSVTTAGRGVSGGHFDFDVYCSTNCSDNTGASAGDYSQGTDAKNLEYTHVHEYDDIYDVTGVDLLNPSQALQKLSRVKAFSGSTTGPTAVKGPKTTLSTATVTGLTSTSNPSNKADITSTTTPEVAVAGFPATTTSGTSTTVTTKTESTTTQVTVTNINETNTKKNGVTTYKYDVQTKTEQWTTTTTSSVTTTPPPSFKVLIHNQAYSPAAKISVGGAPYVDVFKYQVSAGLTMASLPAYTLATVGTLRFNLPLDAFKSRDWGTGVVRAGLHPIKWSCAVKDAKNGPDGERRNGALTIQIVDASVQDSDIQLNVTKIGFNKPENLGYRLKDSSVSSKLIAEYTTFWHHPSDKCMGDSGWVKNPAEDPKSDAVAAIPAAGSTDPKDGTFGSTATPIDTGGPATGTTTTTDTKTTINANGTVTTVTTTIVTTTVTNTDGSKTTTTDTTIRTSTTGLGDNNSTGVTTGGYNDPLCPPGTICTPPCPPGTICTPPPCTTFASGVCGPASATGRINWRELQR
ncbi:MAG: PilC/PilY family type IV pilus protein [Burkholderiaceae bacterium]|nr:PilC/PilY family type IV pilus protein [Burkholderiaceae bacterium]